MDDEASGSEPFIFPQNTLIAPKSYLVFSRQITKIALNNDKDSVRLLLPEGVVFQEIKYEKPPQGKSSARTPDGFIWSISTPGLPNLVGIAISEGKEITYQQKIKPETTKQVPQDYSWYFQNTPQKQIEGGYIYLPTEPSSALPDGATTGEEESQPASVSMNIETMEGKLATVKQTFSRQGSLQLVLIIVAIVLGASAIGLSLVKFRRKKSLPHKLIGGLPIQ